MFDFSVFVDRFDLAVVMLTLNDTISNKYCKWYYRYKIISYINNIDIRVM